MSKFRTRLVEGQAEHLLFEQLLTVLPQRGLVKAGGKQRTGSTHILAAVRILIWLELVDETVRVALSGSPGLERAGLVAAASQPGVAGTVWATSG